MKRVQVSFVVALVFFVMSLMAFAEDEGAEASSSPSENASSEAGNAKTRESTQSLKPRSRKGRAPREKEAEGTQAPHRFDTVIPKSKYEFNGQSLEVDPD